MIILWIFVFIDGSVQEEGATPHLELKNIHLLPNVAAFGDAEHRGPRWYDHEDSNDSAASDSDLKSEHTASSSVSSSSEIASDSASADASSLETNERIRATRANRACTSCPHDMLKKYNNLGIKWICAGYQRARRSFKSPCMMRYRNCQDGTLFVKLYDHRCKNDTYHGKHWFYVYRI